MLSQNFIASAQDIQTHDDAVNFAHHLLGFAVLHLNIHNHHTPQNKQALLHAQDLLFFFCDDKISHPSPIFRHTPDQADG